MKGYLKNIWAMPSPMKLGYDFAGIIVSLPPLYEDGNFKVGDAVFGVNWGQGKHDDNDISLPIGGTFSEYCHIPISKISKKPIELSFDIAAAIPLVATTAYQCLFDCAKLNNNSRILILGGASAVGSIAIQLAKAAGAW